MGEHENPSVSRRRWLGVVSLPVVAGAMGTALAGSGNALADEVEIAAGGTLQATTDATKYHPARGIPLGGDHTMGDGNVGLIHAAEAENITIEGLGTIDGQGAEVRAAGLGGNRRPHLALFYKCKNLV